MDKPPGTRYSAISMTLHWVTAIVVLLAFVYGPGGSEARVYSTSRDFGRQVHESLGLLVFALVIARLLWRLAAAMPEPPPTPRWMILSAKGVQFAMYLILLALPVTAAAGAWLEGHAVTLVTGINVASPLPEHHDTGKAIAEIHTWLGDAIMWLAGLHALAALYHHFLLKDGVLASMLPPWGRRSRER